MVPPCVLNADVPASLLTVRPESISSYLYFTLSLLVVCGSQEGLSSTKLMSMIFPLYLINIRNGEQAPPQHTPLFPLTFLANKRLLKRAAS